MNAIDLTGIDNLASYAVPACEMNPKPRFPHGPGIDCSLISARPETAMRKLST